MYINLVFKHKHNSIAATLCVLLHLAVPVCPPLTAPDNGTIDCSLGDDGQANPGDTCTFTCNDGFERTGSGRRTCNDDKIWTGSVSICTIQGIDQFWFSVEQQSVFTEIIAF